MDTRLVDALNTGIILLDSERFACWANEAAGRITSMGVRQLASEPFEHWVVHEQARELKNSLHHCILNDHSFTFRELIIARDEQVATVDASFSRFQSPLAGGLVLVELSEVDQLLKISRDSKTLSDEEGFRKLAQGLAHEVKNPLGGIKGAAQLLSKEEGAERFNDFLSIIIQEADRLKELVDRLLGSSHTYKNETFNIHLILERTRLLLNAESAGSVEMKRDYDPSLPSIRADQNQLFQAILNIAKNSLEALTESNTNQPCVQFITRAIRRVHPNSRRAQTMLCIRIKDNGPGIPDDLKDRIFFPMVSGRAQGSGIGLSVTQTIIARHKGWIEVASKMGDTTIDVILPFGET